MYTYTYYRAAPLTEDSLVGEVFHDDPYTSWEHAHQYVEVKEEGGPGGGLMLRHTRNDRDMDLGVSVCPGGLIVQHSSLRGGMDGICILYRYNHLQ